MTDNNSDRGLLVGGPYDGEVLAVGDAALLERESTDGVIHRYLRTTQTRDHDGARLPAYQYDGAVDPGRASSGVEDVHDRAASPLADSREGESRGSQSRGTQEPPD